MKVFFDDKEDFYKDLDNLVAGEDKFNTPLIVVPTDRDARTCSKVYSEVPETSHITFISYDYWLSKKWIADDNYDHIDFFRIDQFFIAKSYGVQVGVGTIRRIMGKKKEEVKDAE